LITTKIEETLPFPDWIGEEIEGRIIIGGEKEEVSKLISTNPFQFPDKAEGGFDPALLGHNLTHLD